MSGDSEFYSYRRFAIWGNMSGSNRENAASNNFKPGLHKKTVAVLLFVCLALLTEVIGYSRWKDWNRAGKRHNRNGVEAINHGSFSGAEEEWLQGIKEDPYFAANYENLGDLYWALKRDREATRYYEKAVNLSKEDGEVWLKYARALNRVADASQVLEPARKAAFLLPDSAEAQGQFGLLAAERQEPITALKALLRAHELEPENVSFLSGLMAIELETGKSDQAETQGRAFLAKHPTSPEINFFMAMIFRQKPHSTENVDAALKFGELALRVKRSGWLIRLYDLLGTIHLEKKQYPKAIHYYLLGREAEPGNANMVSGLMRAYGALGETKRSQKLAVLANTLMKQENRKQFLKHALGFNKRDTESALELAKIFEAEENYRDARATYDLAVNEANENNARQAKLQLAEFIKRMKVIAKSQEKSEKNPSKEDTIHLNTDAGKLLKGAN